MDRGVDLVDRIMAAPESTSLFVDFDGVLAPIVGDPAAASAAPGTGPILESLVGQLHRVAVVSGRPLSFLEAHVPPGVDLSGLYGLEQRLAGHRQDHAQAGVWREAIADVVSSVSSGPQQMHLENKGLSITAHYRGHEALASEVEAWCQRQAARAGLVVRPAKQSFELHPPIPSDKGTVIESLCGASTLVIYAGDDVGDLPGFDALDRLAGAGVDTVRIAVGGAEAPGELIDRADITFGSPADFVAELRALTTVLVGR